MPDGRSTSSVRVSQEDPSIYEEDENNEEGDLLPHEHMNIVSERIVE
jgi:hypothetical protein